MSSEPATGMVIGGGFKHFGLSFHPSLFLSILSLLPFLTPLFRRQSELDVAGII